MDKRKIKPDQKTVTNSIGIYYRAIETDSHIYFVNFHEGDESGVVKMYSIDGTLVCNNYFAYGAMEEELEGGEYNWISKRLKKNYEMYKEENN